MNGMLEYECMGARIRYWRKGAGPAILLLKMKRRCRAIRHSSTIWRDRSR